MTKTRAAGDTAPIGPRHDWTLAEVEALFDLPFVDLICRAQTQRRHDCDPHDIQVSALLSIKTGSTRSRMCATPASRSAAARPG